MNHRTSGIRGPRRLANFSLSIRRDLFTKQFRMIEIGLADFVYNFCWPTPAGRTALQPQNREQTLGVGLARWG